MPEAQWIEDTLTISKKEVPVRVGRLRQEDLRFYPDNPRVHSLVHRGDSEPSQPFIQKRLAEMDHVKQLLQSIRANGGLTDPLIVRDDDMVVLEGNSRLAAYRLLARNDPVRWGMVKVKLLPADIDEDIVFALLGEYHIIGRKDWAPYEQAAYLWRRHTHHGIEPIRMATELGISKKLAGQYIRVYQFMVDHGDTDPTRWSYYYELLRSQHVSKVRKQNEDFDRIIVRKIKSGEIPKAADVRDKVVKICRVGGRALSTFLKRKDSLERSYESAISRGADNAWLRRLKKWRDMICDPDTRHDFDEMKDAHIKKCVFELRKLKKGIERLLARLE